MPPLIHSSYYLNPLRSSSGMLFPRLPPRHLNCQMRLLFDFSTRKKNGENKPYRACQSFVTTMTATQCPEKHQLVTVLLCLVLFSLRDSNLQCKMSLKIWLVDRSTIDWLIDWLIDRCSIDCFFDRLIDWPYYDRSVDWPSYDWLIDWLIDFPSVKSKNQNLWIAVMLRADISWIILLLFFYVREILGHMS